jgi:hypothetical protein
MQSKAITAKQYLNELPVLDLFGAGFLYKTFSLPKIVSSNFEIPDVMLGRQAEAIFESIIKASKSYKLMAANIQIQSPTKTIGELDYLLEQRKTKTQIHVELSCKFYLFDPDSLGTFEQKWIGPNKKDSLQDKITKLREKQFPLLFNKNSEKLLENTGFNASKATQQCYLAASLYLPIGQSILTLPKAYQKCVVGYWMYYQQLTIDDTCSYAVVEKKQWLLPPKSISHWCNATEVQVKILESLKNKKAPQVYKKSGADIEKFFVVWWDLK